MELDKRIKEGKRPLTAFDVMESKFIGTDCYFSDKASDYGDLSNCQVGTLVSRDGMTGVFNATKNNSYAYFDYCLPCEWVEEKKEPKYRPYTIDEFLKKFKLGDSIIIRYKGNDTYQELLFTGYSKDYVHLGASVFCFNSLFKCYEFGIHYDEFVPFGVLEE